MAGKRKGGASFDSYRDKMDKEPASKEGLGQLGSGGWSKAMGIKNKEKGRR
jgi:hypothetical protein